MQRDAMAIPSDPELHRPTEKERESAVEWVVDLASHRVVRARRAVKQPKPSPRSHAAIAR